MEAWHIHCSKCSKKFFVNVEVQSRGIRVFGNNTNCPECETPHRLKSDEHPSYNGYDKCWECEYEKL